MDTPQESTQADACYICGYGNSEILQRHHLFPRRLGGGDTDDNTVLVCPTCHHALERIYDDAFWDAAEEILTAEYRDRIDELEQALEEAERDRIRAYQGGRLSIVELARWRRERDV